MKPHLVDFTLSESKPWVLAYLLGQRTKNGSADTLKKQWDNSSPKHAPKGHHLEGFVQVLPARLTPSPNHLQWLGFGLLKSVETNSLHFRQPGLELLARAAGTFQWKDVLEKVSLRPEDNDVILLWMGPREEWDEKSFLRVAKEWGFVSRQKWPRISAHDEIFALERSALVGLE